MGEMILRDFFQIRVRAFKLATHGLPTFRLAKVMTVLWSLRGGVEGTYRDVPRGNLPGELYRGELNSATLIFSLGFNPHNLFGTCHIKRPPYSATLLTIYKENHATQPYLLKKCTFNAALNMSIIKPCGVLLPDGIKPIPVCRSGVICHC